MMYARFSVVHHSPLSAVGEFPPLCIITFLPPLFFFLPNSSKTVQAETMPQTCWKDSNSVRLVLCVESGPGTGFTVGYCYFENALKSALRASSLLQVNLEFNQKELNIKTGECLEQRNRLCLFVDELCFTMT